jgi:hypothetical protein
VLFIGSSFLPLPGSLLRSILCCEDGEWYARLVGDSSNEMRSFRSESIVKQLSRPLFLFIGGLVLVMLALVLLHATRAGASNPDRTARVLLASWKSNFTPPGPAALWSVPPVPEFPGFNLSEGRLGSGLGIALLQKRSHWYRVSQELAFGLIQYSEDPSVWRLSVSRSYRIAGHSIFSRRTVLTTVTKAP